MIRDRAALRLHALEAAYAILLLVWFFLPLVIKDAKLLSVPSLPFAIYGGPPPRIGGLIALSAACYLVPLISLWKLASIFLSDRLPAFADPRRPASIGLGIASSTLATVVFAAHVFSFARGPAFFRSCSPFSYVVLLLSIAYNAASFFRLISYFAGRDAAYKEYLVYKSTMTPTRGGAVAALRRPGIQKRLVLSFMLIIIVVIVTLSMTLLRDFSSTILASVIQNGLSLAERTASVIRSNPADKIAAEDYVFIEAKKNASAQTPFARMAYYIRNPKTGVPSLVASTDKAAAGKTTAAKIEPFTEPSYLYVAKDAIYRFRAPVILSSTFLGYVEVDYARDIIFEPYYRTQIKVVIIAAFFVYAALFIIYVIGRNIAFPILLLRMSVAGISTSLSRMIKGESRISADLLLYQDKVPTKDEIKSLSAEIGNMATVIRGIVPYISASTLKHSEREKPTTEKRDLCFLFTDIRGFTSLCEGMSPERVVEMLNHYLDLQSSIILANEGDVDKFVGDEVMAMFEGPAKERNACAASLAIRKTMAEEKALAIAEKQNVVSIGIGINSGPVVFGSVGAKDRMDFTSIGDTVNLAARLEGANKTYGTKTLVTEAVYEKVKEQYLCREIDMLTVKGKKQPARIYEIIQERERANARLVEMCRLFEEGLAAYRARHWVKAGKAFTVLRDKMSDAPSAVFLQRIEVFKASPPPEGWDGVFAMTVK
jgi:adenylate cyclase